MIRQGAPCATWPTTTPDQSQDSLGRRRQNTPRTIFHYQSVSIDTNGLNGDYKHSFAVILILFHPRHPSDSIWHTWQTVRRCFRGLFTLSDWHGLVTLVKNINFCQTRRAVLYRQDLNTWYRCSKKRVGQVTLPGASTCHLRGMAVGNNTCNYLQYIGRVEER